MAEIKPDILSAISRSGSGLEIKQLVSSLVTAETSGQRALNERRVEETTTTISAMGKLSQEINSFKESMVTTAAAASRVATTSTDAVSFVVSDETSARDVSATLEIITLATPQILKFSFSSDVDSGSSISTGTIEINADGWDSSTEITISDDNDTLADLVQALDDIDGVSAILIDTGDGLSLIVKSEDGTTNSLDDASIAAIEGILGVSSDVQEATDAVFTVDGVTVTRGTNSIDDVFTGHTLTLNSIGTTKLASSQDSDSVLDRVTDFLAQVNTLKSYLATATARGINGAEPGPLAGDLAAQSILSRVRDMTTQPIYGFGSEPVYLAQLGIQTERDGTLTLNTDRFQRAIEENPKVYEAIFATQFSSTDSNLSVSGVSFSTPTPGSYALIYDPDTVPVTATLNGYDVTVTSNDDGSIRLQSWEDDTYGIKITMTSNVATTTEVRYGKSLAEILSDYSEVFLAQDGTLARRQQQLDESLIGFEDQLTAIEEKTALLTDRYNRQFGKMESIITSLNKTGEYMKSLMDAWNADK